MEILQNLVPVPVLMEELASGGGLLPGGGLVSEAAATRGISKQLGSSKNHKI